MPEKRPTPALIMSGLIVLLGIIHFAVGLGIAMKYRQYRDVFRQSVGLCAFNIIIGIYAIAVGVMGLVSLLTSRGALSKVVAIMSGVLGFITVISLITALILNSQSISFIRNRLSYNMNTYIQSEEAIFVTDRVQTQYQCCGVNLWLDWARIALGATAGPVVSQINGRRRRRHEDKPSPLSVLSRAVRQISPLRPTDINNNNNNYNLPSSYSVNLPLSCCRSGGAVLGNSVGGYCVYSANNGTSGFYVNGCLSLVANVVVSQITGIVLINTVLAILAIVLIPVLISVFPEQYDPSNPNNKQPLEYQVEQERQQQQQQQQEPQQVQYQQPIYGAGYYQNNAIQNTYPVYTAPTYMVYQ